METKKWILILLILLAVVAMLLRQDKNFNEQFCETCKEEADCESFCTKLCVKGLYDKVGYLGYNKEGIYCKCECSTSIKALLR